MKKIVVLCSVLILLNSIDICMTAYGLQHPNIEENSRFIKDRINTQGIQLIDIFIKLMACLLIGIVSIIALSRTKGKIRFAYYGVMMFLVSFCLIIVINNIIVLKMI